MNWKTDYWMDRYSSLLKKGQDLPRSYDSPKQDAEFVLKQQMVFRNPETGKSRPGRITQEVYGSAAECLSCIRWYKIPSRLREITGLKHENDIESLLDAAGYRSSMVAEELFHMIDNCLKCHIITSADLNMIRKAYNGISGFKRLEEHRIASMGYACSKTENEEMLQNASSVRSLVRADYKAVAV